MGAEKMRPVRRKEDVNGFLFAFNNHNSSTEIFHGLSDLCRPHSIYCGRQQNRHKNTSRYMDKNIKEKGE